uniref:Reverse transcriptase domain-containing protein n=1 Tax=Tanacetum cinerariifolium TaxID=118510 RepID=A0A6L2J622_TANCI|nr:reverse transcriptase domain-containing protein [Tanacetum cinerariifolium]
MADTRTMEELLLAPIEGYGDAIVIPVILADNFKLKHDLLNLVTYKQFCGLDREDPHAHISWFNKITSTIKYKDVPNTSIKLMLFLFSIKGATRIWLEKEPPRSIATWEDLVSKFINQFFPPSKTTNLRNEITNFQQHFDELFCEAWEHFKDLLHACPHHDFTELHQIDTFYNSLTSNDQDSLNAATGGNLLTKTPREALTLIERSSTLPSNTITNPKGNLKEISTRSGVSYNGPLIPPPFSAPSKVVEKEPEVTKDTVQPNTKEVQPPDVQTQTPISERIIAPKPKTNIPYPSRLNNQKLRERDDHQMMNFFKSFEAYPSILKNLSLPELTPTQMILELADRSTTRPTGIAEDVFVKVGKFHFPADFVVVDYVVNPRVPINLGRPFLRMAQALIDVHGEELTLRVSDEAITFKVDNTSRYSYNDAELINQIDVIDVSCEEYSQEVLGFSDNSKSGNPLQFLKLSLLTLHLNSPELELKDLPSHLEYAFLEGTDKLLVIIAKKIKDDEKECLIKRRVNMKIHEVIKKEVIKLLDAGLIYPISDTPWVSPVHYVPKKGGITVVKNENNELIPTRLVTRWRFCIDYRKLNDAIQKDHFPLPFKDQMLERLARNEYYCFLDGFSGYFQIPIDPQDQEKTTFTCLYGTFAYRRMPFGLCNAPGMFQRCMMAIFHDMIEETWKSSWMISRSTGIPSHLASPI